MCDDNAFEDNLARTRLALEIYAEYITETAPSRVRDSFLLVSKQAFVQIVEESRERKKYKLIDASVP